MNGLSDVCKIILESDAEKNPKDYGGMTPLHYAAKKGHTEVCKLILDNLDPLNYAPRNGNGKTPLDYAKYYGHSKVVDLILSFKNQVILMEGLVNM